LYADIVFGMGAAVIIGAGIIVGVGAIVGIGNEDTIFTVMEEFGPLQGYLGSLSTYLASPLHSAVSSFQARQKTSYVPTLVGFQTKERVPLIPLIDFAPRYQTQFELPF